MKRNRAGLHGLECPDRSIDAETSRALVDRAVDHIVALSDQPASILGGGAELSRSFVEPLPEKPTSFDDLLDLLFGLDFV